MALFMDLGTPEQIEAFHTAFLGSDFTRATEILCGVVARHDEALAIEARMELDASPAPASVDALMASPAMRGQLGPILTEIGEGVASAGAAVVAAFAGMPRASDAMRLARDQGRCGDVSDGAFEALTRLLDAHGITGADVLRAAGIPFQPAAIA